MFCLYSIAGISTTFSHNIHKEANNPGMLLEECSISCPGAWITAFDAPITPMFVYRCLYIFDYYGICSVISSLRSAIFMFSSTRLAVRITNSGISL